MTVLITIEGVLQDFRGGAQPIVYYLSHYLAKKGHRVIILTRRTKRGSSFYRKDGDVEIYYFNAPPKGNLFYFLWPLFSIINAPRIFRRIDKKYHFDLINYHHPFAAFGIELFAWPKLKKVFTFHAPRSSEIEIEFKGKIYSFLIPFLLFFINKIEKFVLNRVNVVVILSNFMRKKLSEVHGKIPARIEKIPAGVDPEIFRPSNKGQLREELRLPQNKIILFTVRRLAKRMGLENLILAMEKVIAQREDILLLIGGKGKIYQNLENLIRENNLEKNIKLLGFISQSDLPKFYQASDLFILPTEKLEGFGLVILEAFATNVPVLGTPAGAIPEVIRNFNEKLISKGCSPHDIANLILLALNESETLNLYQDYRKKVLQEYTWRKVNQKYEDLFSETIRE